MQMQNQAWKFMGKVKQPLCSASEAVPQKVAVSASRNVSLAGRWTLFLKVHSVQCSALVGLFPYPSSLHNLYLSNETSRLYI